MKSVCVVRAMMFLGFLAALVLGCAGQSQVSRLSSEQIEASIPPYTPTGREPKVAVFDFRNGSFFDSNTLGPGVASMVEAVLVRSQRFVVVDRQNLERMLKEKKLMMDGVTANFDYSRIGRQLNLDYIVSGSVTEFGVKSEGTSFTAGVASFSTVAGGGIRLNTDEATARVVVDVKVTDVVTGQIKYVGTAKGEESSSNTGAGILLITAVGGGVIGGSSGVIGFDETLAGKASRIAATRFVKDLVEGNFIRPKQK